MFSQRTAALLTLAATQSLCTFSSIAKSRRLGRRCVVAIDAAATFIRRRSRATGYSTAILPRKSGKSSPIPNPVPLVLYYRSSERIGLALVIACRHSRAAKVHPGLASWDILSRPLRQAQGRLCGTGPSSSPVPRTTSWATLSRPLRQAQGRLFGTDRRTPL